ncbi:MULTISPECIES: sugar porter family MFS transporter [Bacillus amyloliquefaciens group]|uniref:sugar porter family MFS transporter n=1 Tax=Bacillus amyloliquefaciens group TaxID=1938374 RepID=UPI0022801638|nr:sugar porter family MFS transporter [Bacillus velezensis]MCY7441982.1 sugar porter family MFS transporter [Bacillus velezensis]
MKKNTKKYLIYFFGALGGLLYGYDTGVISGALLFINNDIPLNTLTEGLVVSMLLLGAIFGSALSGTCSDRWGRRKVVFVLSLIFIIGALACAASQTVTMLIISRVILGLAVGGSTALVPVYLSEMAPTKIRGTLGTLNNLMIVTGILLAYIVNYIFTPFEAWRWMVGLAAVPAALLLIGIAFMPESPRWLVKRGREQEARQVMEMTHDKEDIAVELAEMKQGEAEKKESTLGLLKAKWIRPMLLIGIGLAIFQQAVGINTVIYYAPTIFTKAGLGTSASVLGTMGIGVLNVIMCITAMILIDRIGRKKLLMWGSVGITLSLASLSAILLLAGLSASTAWLTVLFLGIYIVFYQATWGPVVWVLMPELFPSNARGAATGFTTLILSATNLIVSLVFPLMLSAMGIGWVFGIFSVICLSSFFFTAYIVPETKGRSLEEIETHLKKRFSLKKRSKQNQILKQRTL